MHFQNHLLEKALEVHLKKLFSEVTYRHKRTKNAKYLTKYLNEIHMLQSREFARN